MGRVSMLTLAMLQYHLYKQKQIIAEGTINGTKISLGIATKVCL